jgi:hypothetical protein
MNKVPHQSLKARFPGASIAAGELGVNRGHLHAVLSGKRESKSLTSRWNEWLRKNPQFAAIQTKARRSA